MRWRETRWSWYPMISNFMPLRNVDSGGESSREGKPLWLRTNESRRSSQCHWKEVVRSVANGICYWSSKRGWISGKSSCSNWLKEEASYSWSTGPPEPAEKKTFSLNGVWWREYMMLLITLSPWRTVDIRCTVSQTHTSSFSLLAVFAAVLLIGKSACGFTVYVLLYFCMKLRFPSGSVKCLIVLSSLCSSWSGVCQGLRGAALFAVCQQHLVAEWSNSSNVLQDNRMRVFPFRNNTVIMAIEYCCWDVVPKTTTTT